jgi:hypothetical protein
MSHYSSRILAEKPKPCRIKFILEIIYGGWTLIRRTVKAVFSNYKDLQCGTLLNFLDNYCLTVLCSNSILFKTNYFSNHYDSIIRMWVMMYSFRRHHKRKSLLIWRKQSMRLYLCCTGRCRLADCWRVLAFLSERMFERFNLLPIRSNHLNNHVSLATLV